MRHISDHVFPNKVTWKPGKRKRNTLLVLHTVQDPHMDPTPDKFVVVRILGLFAEWNDYGETRKFDQAIDGNGLNYWESAAPIIGWWWMDSNGGTWYDVTRRKILDPPITKHPKWLQGRFAQVVKWCPKHGIIHLKRLGCYECKGNHPGYKDKEDKKENPSW